MSRLLTGQIRDNDIKGRATDAFTELVARLYFNTVTAALGNLCNPGCAIHLSFPGWSMALQTQTHSRLQTTKNSALA